VPPSRFAPEINRLRAALRGHRGSDLIATISHQVEQLPVAALVADNSQRYVAANAAAQELTGYTQSELAALTVADLTPVPRSADGQQLWEEFIGKGGQYGAYDLQPKRGAAKHVLYWAFASVAPGLHLSLLVPVDAEAGAAI
jgi:PAS domain S-box-containing protein